jgi:hypothetical protein
MKQVSHQISNSSKSKSASTFFSASQINGTPFFQAKLQVGPTNDVYEKEADAVADKVMRMPENENEETARPSPTPVTSVVQSKCANCEDEPVQRSESSEASTQREAPSIVSEAISRGGNSLDHGTQSFMENKLGYDFSNVRIHDNVVAAKSADAINALAYTSGNNIVFNQGQYSPDTNSGKKLLAHELTHVVQQSHAPRSVQRMVRVNSGVELDTMGYSVKKTGDFYMNDRISKSSVWNEIVTGLFFSDRVFNVIGTTNAEANKNFMEHIRARHGVIEFASKKKYGFAAGAGFKMNEEYWDVDHAKGSIEVKPGKNRQEALDDLNVNPKKYEIACEAATAFTMVGGGKSPFKIETGRAEDDWIPGDWGYIKNDNFPRPGGKPGLEGENIIYVGLDQYWGHFTDKNEYKTLQQWFDQVKGWHGAATITGSRRYPLRGLDL